MSVINMRDVDLAGKRVFIRADLNVPLQDGKVSSDARITASLPTIQYALQQGAKVMVTSHLGRPEEGVYSAENSLQPVADVLSQKLSRPVRLIKDWVQGGFEVAAGELVLLENCRFNVGEKKNLDSTAQAYAALCDVFVMDAFGTAHRAEATTHGIAKFAPIACAGFLLTEELDALGKALMNPARPLVAIVGGSKVSTKLTVLESLADKVDQLVVGGGIANTFLKANGAEIGNSLCEDDLLDTAKQLMQTMAQRGAAVPMAVDVVTGKQFAPDAQASIKPVQQVQADDMIFDIGPQSAQQLVDIIMQAGTVVWNGPLGVFEFEQFSAGTKAIAMAIANTKAFTLAGGGDTIAAIQKFDIYDKVSYISTAGGAFLEFLEGKKLPAVDILEQRAQQPLAQSSIKSLPLIHRGKVRDIYDIDAKHMLLIASDRLSAFDVILPTPIPNKGALLTQIANFWFERLGHIIPNHLTGIDPASVVKDPAEQAQLGKRALVVKKLSSLPIEAIVRGYLVGSGWKEYQQTGAVCGITLPAGLREAEQLPQPLFTPSSKAAVGDHDENISQARCAELIGQPLAQQVAQVSLRLYQEAAAYALTRGIIIADTKFEFGLDEQGQLHLIDEVLTPDSSRFWPAEQYQVGKNPPSFDKQYVRDWLESSGWNKTPPAPVLPADVAAKTSEKYQQAYRQLTGKEFI